ncbi:MAG: hypothetical protein HZB16_05165 [Armatimonadetes bacterium]|nr:hypothetical protein [Armatimonadota bacterium]
MASEIWLHLLAWELRYAVRRSALWVMVASAALAPPLFGWAMARAYDQPLPILYAPACGAQALLLALLVASWTAFSVKRQVGAELSDDWLMVITWRQSLLVRYVAAALLGLLMAVASVGTMLLVARLDPNAPAGLHPAQWSAFGAVLQGLASAAVVVGAADFLLASEATVLSVQLAFTAFWSFVPVMGYFWPAWMLTDPFQASPGCSAAVFGLVATFACCWALALGWRRSEDFWALLKAEHRKGQDVSIGEIRSEIAGSQSGNSASGRQALAEARTSWRLFDLEPIFVHDLARFPALSLPRSSEAWQRAVRFAGWMTGVLLIYAAGFRWISGSNVEVGVWRIFCWWAGALVVMLRALASGVQIVAEEREQCTLPALAITPVGLAHALSAKVLVVLVQAAPWLVLLRLAAAGHRELPIALVAVLTASAAMVGPLAAAWFSGRLVAVMVGGLGAAVLGLSLMRFIYRPVASAYSALEFALPLPHGEWLPTLLVVGALAAAWHRLRVAASAGLYRAAGELGQGT